MQLKSPALLFLLVAACASDVQPIETHDSDHATYSEAFDRWMYFGFGMADQSRCYGELAPQGWPTLVYPQEIFAAGEEFTRLCNGAVAREADGTCTAAEGCAKACQTYVPGTHDPLIVIASHVTDERELRSTRAHEAYHWIAECSGVATDWANEQHMVPGVWAPVSVGDEYLMQPFETP